jgi:hypothetical protein
MQRALLLPPLLAAGGCATAATAPEPERYAGFFESGFEVEAFHPCEVDEVLLVRPTRQGDCD